MFPRIDMKKEDAAVNESVNQEKPAVAEKTEEKKENEYITIDDFARMDLRVAEVISCEKMPKADKLLVLRLKVGDSERTVVSGIAQYYQPEDLIGKRWFWWLT